MNAMNLLNLVLWSVQGFLALFFLAAGAPKLLGRGIERWTGFSDVPRPLVVLWLGGYQVLKGRISIGSFVMFNTYMGMLVWPMIALGWVVNLMQRGTASLDRINEILAEKSRALMQRKGRARDVYDLVNISRNFREHADPERARFPEHQRHRDLLCDADGLAIDADARLSRPAVCGLAEQHI